MCHRQVESHIRVIRCDFASPLEELNPLDTPSGGHHQCPQVGQDLVRCRIEGQSLAKRCLRTSRITATHPQHAQSDMGLDQVRIEPCCFGIFLQRQKWLLQLLGHSSQFHS